MAGESPTSLRWLTLAVLLPLLVLGVLAWLGTRAQVRAAWSSAREEAKRVGELEAIDLSGLLLVVMKTAPLFPDPPQPGTASPADAVLDGKDLEALRALREDRDAGISPGGLPRRVLAGFRLFGLTGAPEDARNLMILATRDEPSILTAAVFSRIEGLSTTWRDEWTSGDGARAIFRLHPEIDSRGKWVTNHGEMWWLASDGTRLRYLDPEAVVRAFRLKRVRPLAWAGLRLSAGGSTLGTPLSGEIMASIPVSFSGIDDGGMVGRPPSPVVGDLRLEIVAARPALIEATARQQARWTLGLLLLAFATSVSALVFIHRAVERERRLNALKSDFVASVSHELRAPVASIRLMADALNAGKIEPRTVGEFHRLISREGARLSTLIENVLDFARIEQGRKSWHLEPTDLRALLTETLGIMEPLAAEKSISLVSPEPFPAIEANVDPGAIQQALVNLLDNAIKFSPAGSRVNVHLQANGSNWEIQVADQGPGIPAAEHERVFQKFHRLGSELRRETQGTGIGLSLVKAVAEAHGGRVVLASVPGQGSTFTLIGPISPIGPILHSSPP